MEGAVTPLEIIANATWFDDDHEGSDYERYVGESLASTLIERLAAAGFVIVPAEPTEAMCVEGAGSPALDVSIGTYEAAEIWRAMLAASAKQ